jgi:hypothetical protein
MSTAIPNLSAPLDYENLENDPRCKLNKTGYLEINRCVVHRLKYSHLVEKIRPGWEVHHINQCKLDNRLENLIALPAKCHVMIHGRMQERGVLIGRSDVEYLLEQYLEETPYTALEIAKIERRVVKREARAVKFKAKRERKARRKKKRAIVLASQMHSPQRRVLNKVELQQTKELETKRLDNYVAKLEKLYNMQFTPKECRQIAISRNIPSLMAKLKAERANCAST